MTFDPISPSAIPAEAYEAAYNIAEHKLAMFGNSLKKRWRKNREAKRIIKEAESWPLSRCAEVLPYVYPDESHQTGIFHDGTLRFAMALIWLAPFPVYYVSMGFTCELRADAMQGSAPVMYTVLNQKITNVDHRGDIEFLQPGVNIVGLNLRPDRSVTLDDLGPSMPQISQTKLGRLVDVKQIQIVAHGPWKMVRDVVQKPDAAVWLPRW